MSEFKIETDIPVPLDTRGPKAKYPWRQMSVGDSFFIAGKTAGKLGSGPSKARKATGWKFTSRTVIENGVRGVRVWRVE